MKFEEWKKEFTKKCDVVVEAFKDIHKFTNELEQDGSFEEDEFLLFVALKAKRLGETIENLG